MTLKGLGFFALGAMIVVCLTLLIGGKRVLVHERKVEPGEYYPLPGYANVGQGEQASLVCRYFTGRGVVATVFWYSPNNIMGKDQCPFVTSE